MKIEGAVTAMISEYPFKPVHSEKSGMSEHSVKEWDRNKKMDHGMGAWTNA